MKSLQTVEDGGVQQQKLLRQTGVLLGDVAGRSLNTMTIETEIEFNFAVVKIRRKVIHKNGFDDE